MAPAFMHSSDRDLYVSVLSLFVLSSADIDTSIPCNGVLLFDSWLLDVFFSSLDFDFLVFFFILSLLLLFVDDFIFAT